jgi:DDE superfamily endonuclease
MAEFQATCHERLPHRIPPDNTLPLRVFSQDDSRCGWLTVRRRRLTARGVHPVGLVQHTFAWCSVDGAVAPAMGECCFLELPDLNTDTCHILVDAFAHAFPDSCNILRLEHRGAHTAQRLRWPANVQPVWLPPYGPELNPIERVWRDVKDDLAWLQFPELDAPQVYVGDWLQAYDASTLQALTGYAYWQQALNALSL